MKVADRLLWFILRISIITFAIILTIVAYSQKDYAGVGLGSFIILILVAVEFSRLNPE